MDNTVTIDGSEYVLGKIKLGVGRKLKEKYPDTTDFNIAFIAESLKAGGNEDASVDWVEKNVNYFDGEFTQILLMAFSVNGLETKTPQPGEEKPLETAAE